ncbi:MAG: hypothetical protein ROO71_08880 [Balneola sp.]
MSYNSGTYVPKNQLERDQIELLKKHDRKLLQSDADMEAFQEMIIEALKQLNEDNPRCDAFSPSWHELGGDEHDYFISGIRAVRFRIYQIKD